MTSIIPNFEDMQVVDKDGNWTPAWKNIMQSLFSFLQQNNSQEGLFLPQQTTTNISFLSTKKSVGSIVFDSDTNEFKACRANGATGEYKVINLV